MIYLSILSPVQVRSNWEVLCQKQVSRPGTSNYIPQYLWDVIACSCPWYPLLVQYTWTQKMRILSGINMRAQHCKRDSCRDANFVVTGSWCHQWRQSCHHDNTCISMQVCVCQQTSLSPIIAKLLIQNSLIIRFEATFVNANCIERCV